MGNCIICGKPVDGLVCGSHEEDVAFEFEGTSPSQLTPGRFYRGSVDGYADFGVFVDVGDHVTGLLHRSELDRRLESLEWERGDTVYVQVLDVRDNGNVDLGWSIRQSAREFRGELIDAPDGERLPDDEETADEGSDGGGVDEGRDGGGVDDGRADVATEPTPEPVDAASGAGGTAGGTSTDGTAAATPTMEVEEPDTPLKRTTVDALSDQVGSVVRLEGEIIGVRQTSGPTVFELSDETGTVECAAFEEAGVRAYPAVDVGDVVGLEGEVERHHGSLQVETERLERLEDEALETVESRLAEAVETEARPAAFEPLADHDAVLGLEEELLDAATEIRRAVVEARPVVIRHAATADGYVAGAALERAILPLVREKHTRDDAEYHYVERRPLEGRIYDMDAATDDVTDMLEARDRHGEGLPLFVLVGTGSTAESVDAYELLDVYGADRLVIDDASADGAVADAVSVVVTPPEPDGTVTATALSASVATHVNADVRGELAHLPAISYWEAPPEEYVSLAAEAGYDGTAVSDRREAVALEAYYQSYKDKRELVADLLFGDGEGAEGDLAAHVSEQFRAKLDAELETARLNAERIEADGVAVLDLDTAAFTHRFDFPSTGLLLDELFRREREGEPFVLLGLDEDELHLRATPGVDVRELGERVAEAAPDAGVRAVGGRDGHLEFLVGERAAVREAALEAVGELLG